MNAILGYTQIMQHDEKLTDDQRSSVNAIYRSCNHLLVLINNILDISKIEAGKTKLNYVDFDLCILISEIHDMFKVRCNAKKLAWVVNCNNNSDSIPVYGDETKIKQILINLVGNSTKFTDTGSVTLNVQLKDKNQYLFEVIDTGPGIAKDEQEFIFDKFTQEAAGLKKGGSGLGLSICKTQLEAMDSTLCFESIPDKETRFFFILTIQPAKNYITSLHKTHQKVHLPADIHVKALVVDDISANRDVLSKMLCFIGIEVIEACDGQTAISLVETYLPDIIFIDYLMPEMNGSETINEITKKIGKNFKSVLVTAHAYENNVNITSTGNFEKIIRKPYKQKEIFSCVSELLDIELEFINDDFIENKDNDSKSDDDLYVTGLPDSLLRKLNEAIEYCEISDIETIAEDIKALDKKYLPFALNLLKAANNFDISTLQALIKKLAET